MSKFTEEEADFVSGEAGEREDDDVFSYFLVDYVGQVGVFELGGEEEVLLRQLVDSVVLVGHGYTHWVAQGSPLQFLYLVGHGGGEEHGLPVYGQRFYNSVDLACEIVAQQFVSLVHDQAAHVGVGEGLGILHVVEHLSGCANHNVRAHAQSLDLALDVHGTDDHCYLEADPRTDGLEVV